MSSRERYRAARSRNRSPQRSIERFTKAEYQTLLNDIALESDYIGD